MNENNDLERRLRSWAPRRPSARLEARLFPAPGPVAPPPAFRLSWLAPAAVTCLLMVILFNPHRNPSLSDSRRAGPMVAVLLSNQSLEALSPARLPRPKSPPLAGAFEWTNQSGSSINTVHFIRVTN